MPYDQFVREQIAGDLLPASFRAAAQRAVDRHRLPRAGLARPGRAEPRRLPHGRRRRADQRHLARLHGRHRRLRALPRSQVRSHPDHRLLRHGRHLQAAPKCSPACSAVRATTPATSTSSLLAKLNYAPGEPQPEFLPDPAEQQRWNTKAAGGDRRAATESAARRWPNCADRSQQGGRPRAPRTRQRRSEAAQQAQPDPESSWTSSRCRRTW